MASIKHFHETPELTPDLRFHHMPSHNLGAKHLPSGQLVPYEKNYLQADSQLSGGWDGRNGESLIEPELSITKESIENKGKSDKSNYKTSFFDS
jgi:hypothetical protein